MLKKNLAKKGNIAVLNALIEAREPLYLKEIASCAGISLSTAHAAIRELLKEKLIKKIPAPRYEKYELNYDRALPDWIKFDKGIFLVNALAIIYKNGKILIGLREKDPYVPKLSWCFPGGRPGYEKDLEDYIKEEVKKKTNLDVEGGKIIFAKTYPEKREFLSVYYFCGPKSGTAKPGDKLTELKWVKPTEVTKYFTTSLHPKLYAFLEKLEKQGI